MKPYCLFLLLIVMQLNVGFCKVKNGYSTGIANAWESLKALNALLLDDKGFTPAEKRILETRKREVVNFITYFELTERLLKEFRSVSPHIYNEIDTLRDFKGRITDVYIRFISREQARVQAWGITNIAHVKGDDDAYLSEFGENTVSVKVWIVDKALLVLSHELGHVKYQVTNLAAYFKYYKEIYPPEITDPNNIGHVYDDPSGQNALAFEKIFRDDFFRHWKRGSTMAETPTQLREHIRKEILSTATLALTNL